METLGHDFMNEVGGRLQEADLYLSGAGKVELAEHKAKTVLPDDEPLLLRMSFGKNYVDGQQDVTCVKHDHKLYISLSDFFLSANVDIKVNVAKGTATGWYSRQDNTFSLDVARHQVALKGVVQNVAPEEIRADDADIMVDSALLEKWFKIDFDYDFSTLTAQVDTTQPFPVEQAWQRSQRTGAQVGALREAELPPARQGYGLASLPYIDTDLGMSLTHSPGSAATKQENWSTIASGDYAGFNTHAYFSGTGEKPYLNSARITMGKEDADGNLLGPLHATTYQFGDVESVSNSMIGGGGQERGVVVGNHPLTNNTSRTYTQIKGDSHPGWDVELYRNDVYIDIRHVSADGRYDFGNVDLVVGDNDFRLVFYGPQGEQTETHRHIGVNSKTVPDNSGYYAVSATQTNRTMWQRNTSNTPGSGDLHTSASYEYGIGGFGSVNAGLRTSNDQGTYRTFGQAGLATSLRDVFYNMDLGTDLTTGAYSTSMTLRHNFGKQAALVQYQMSTRNYNTSSPTAGSINKDQVRFSLSGPLFEQFLFMDRTNYTLGDSISHTYTGITADAKTATFTTRVKSILFTAALSYNQTQSSTGTTTTATSDFGLRGFAFGGGWRANAQYDLKPVKQMTGAGVEYDHAIGEHIDSTTEISYVPTPRQTAATVGLNWVTPKAIISPRVAYDNSHNLSANVNVHFGLSPDPYEHHYTMTNNYITDTGGVAARIFQDKNGNGVYDAGEPMLSGIGIEAVQGDQSALSNDDGIAFIPDLPKNQRTDIVVNASSSEDAYSISLFKGASVIPHSGAVTKIDFPIVDSGEMDGQADIVARDGTHKSARGASLALIAPDGTVEKTSYAESDGYWAFSVIRPGVYYITATPGDETQGFMVPHLIEFKPDGTTLFGQTVSLMPGRSVKFKFSSDNPAPYGANHARVIRPGDLAGQAVKLEIGPFHSRLALALAWYRLKGEVEKMSGGLTLGTPLQDVVLDQKSGEMSLALVSKYPLSIDQGISACQTVDQLDFDCTVHVVTTYRQSPDQPAAITVVSEKDIKQRNVASMQRSQTGFVPLNEEQVTAKTMGSAVASETLADLNDYVASNPEADLSGLKGKSILLNLGSYNSRELMSIVWYRLRMRNADAIGNARLLVRPTRTGASQRTGKYTLRAILPGYDPEDAKRRCQMLNARGQVCTPEALPSGLQSLSDSKAAKAKG